MCNLQSILSVTVRQIRFFCIYVFVNLYPGFTKELFNFYSEDIFPPRGKKTNSYLAPGALSAHAKFEVAYKIYYGYLVRSAKHNWQFLNRTLVLALGNIAEGAMGFSAFSQQKRTAKTTQTRKARWPQDVSKQYQSVSKLLKLCRKAVARLSVVKELSQSLLSSPTSTLATISSTTLEKQYSLARLVSQWGEASKRQLFF